MIDLWKIAKTKQSCLLAVWPQKPYDGPMVHMSIKSFLLIIYLMQKRKSYRCSHVCFSADEAFNVGSLLQLDRLTVQSFCGGASSLFAYPQHDVMEFTLYMTSNSRLSLRLIFCASKYLIQQHYTSPDDPMITWIYENYIISLWHLCLYCTVQYVLPHSM